MAVSTTSKAFAGRIAKGATTITTMNRRATGAAANAAKQTILTVARGDTGGDLRLSRWGRRGIKLGVGYRTTSTNPTHSVARVEPRPLGVWRTLSDGSSPHAILPGHTARKIKRAGASTAGRAGPTLPASVMADLRRPRKGNARVLSFGIGRGAAAYAQHPGSTGKNTWKRGVEAARPVASAAYRTAHSRALREAYRR